MFFFSAKLLLTDQDRFSRNANHHDHNHHHHDHDHDPESILGKKLYNNKKNDICLCLAAFDFSPSFKNLCNFM